MKKSIVIGLLVILSIFMLTACKKKNETYNLKLRIKESSWSGWTENYEPEEVTKEYDVVLGKEYSIASGNLTFTIEEINDDNIVIKTTEPFSDRKDGVDLRSKKTEFKVYLDEEKKLATPTMDAGKIYYLMLVK